MQTLLARRPAARALPAARASTIAVFKSARVAGRSSWHRWSPWLTRPKRHWVSLSLSLAQILLLARGTSAGRAFLHTASWKPTAHRPACGRRSAPLAAAGARSSLPRHVARQLRLGQVLPSGRHANISADRRGATPSNKRNRPQGSPAARCSAKIHAAFLNRKVLVSFILIATS